MISFDFGELDEDTNLKRVFGEEKLRSIFLRKKWLIINPPSFLKN